MITKSFDCCPPSRDLHRLRCFESTATVRSAPSAPLRPRRRSSVLVTLCDRGAGPGGRRYAAPFLLRHSKPVLQAREQVITMASWQSDAALRPSAVSQSFLSVWRHTTIESLIRRCTFRSPAHLHRCARVFCHRFRRFDPRDRAQRDGQRSSRSLIERTIAHAR